jgi:hypothetical protein
MTSGKSVLVVLKTPTRKMMGNLAQGYKVPKCGNCGSNNILKDAYARWCTDSQEWVLQHTFDYTICDDCGSEENWEMVDENGE